MFSSKRNRYYPRKSILHRFEEKFERSDSCWNWKAGIGSHGYGSMFIEKTPRLIAKVAHRLSWEFYVGEIPDGLQVLHKCDNRKCVNPEHLFLGTQKENIEDCIAKNRFKYATRKLHESQIHRIREGIALNVSAYSLAHLYGVNRRAIQNIANGKTWRKAP